MPTLSSTQYTTSLRDWLGLQNHQINEMLPTLGGIRDPESRLSRVSYSDRQKSFS